MSQDGPRQSASRRRRKAPRREAAKRAKSSGQTWNLQGVSFSLLIGLENALSVPGKNAAYGRSVPESAAKAARGCQHDAPRLCCKAGWLRLNLSPRMDCKTA